MRNAGNVCSYAQRPSRCTPSSHKPPPEQTMNSGKERVQLHETVNVLTRSVP